MKKLIAETGAGQHGVALASAAALVQLECEIHMGEVDIKKEWPNVRRMQVRRPAPPQTRRSAPPRRSIAPCILIAQVSSRRYSAAKWCPPHTGRRR